MTPEEKAQEIAKITAELDQFSSQTRQDWEAVKGNPTRSYVEAAMEREIYEAAVGSKFPDLALGAIAKSYGCAVELVRDIAKTLVEKRTGHDVEVSEFNQAVQAVKRIEESIEDAGLREWKIQNLAKRFKRSPGQLMAAYSKALINQAPVEPLSIKEFREQNSQEIDWLIPGWIPKGTTMLLHADGGVGKTLFCYEIMEAVAKGQRWNDYHVEQGPVLLVQLDEPSIVTQERIDIRGIEDSDPVFILKKWQVEALPRLANYIEKNRPSLVIIDSLTAINKNSIFSENDAEYARPLLHLTELADEYKCSFIIIHHSNALGGSRGTGAIRNSVSEVWGLKTGETQNERFLKVEKTRLGRAPGSYKFLFSEEDYSFRYLGESDEEDTSASANLEQQIYLWLGEDQHIGVPYAPIELAETLAVSVNTVRKRLYELWGKGMVKRRRSKAHRGHVYYRNQTDPCDPSDPSDLCHSDTRISSPNPATASDAAPSDPSDPSFSENSEKVFKNTDHMDQFSPKPAPEAEKQTDPSSDPCISKADHLDHSDHFDCEVVHENFWLPAKYLRELDNLKICPKSGKLSVWHRVEISISGKPKRIDVPAVHLVKPRPENLTSKA